MKAATDPNHSLCHNCGSFEPRDAISGTYYLQHHCSPGSAAEAAVVLAKAAKASRTNAMRHKDADLLLGAGFAIVARLVAARMSTSGC